MQPEPAPAPPLLAALVGVLGSLALLALASVVACLACRRRGQQPLAQRTPAATQLEPLRGQEDGEDAAENSEDRGPDVVREGRWKRRCGVGDCCGGTVGQDETACAIVYFLK